MPTADAIVCRGRTLSLARPRIMGILNVTPDSFSDGGVDAEAGDAVARAVAMARQGADIIDVGGESTRPGAAAVGEDEQIRRTVPVIAALAMQWSQAGAGERCDAGDGGEPFISIDTQSPVVAAAALEAGATIINDINAGRAEGMLELAAGSGAGLVLMHMQGTPTTMQTQPRYDDVVAEVLAFLLERADAAMRAGVKRGQIVIDPGIGFGKTLEHNVALLANLERFVASGYPVLLGTSRKRFLGLLSEGAGQSEASSPRDLLGATCATTALAVAAGVRLLRVHDVAANRQAAIAAWAIAEKKGTSTISLVLG